jgi:TorA maturation chaperone TorD
MSSGGVIGCARAVRDADAAVRANVYFALARALRPPRSWEDELPELIRRAFDPLPEPLSDLGVQLSDEMRSLLADRQAAEIEYARLFLGPFEIAVAPWASLYLEEEPKLMGAVSEYTARAYAEAGLAPCNGLKDAPDHVTHELEFAYYLSFTHATTEDEAWAHRQERFWREHLGRWLPRFAEALTGAATLPFYTTLGVSITAVCEAVDDGPGHHRR